MKVEKIDWFDTIDLACKAKGKFGVYVNDMRDFNDDEIDKHQLMGDVFLNHAKYVLGEECSKETGEMGGLYFFDTETEMETFYKIFESELFESSCVFAYTVHKDGYGLTENT